MDKTFFQWMTDDFRNNESLNLENESKLLEIKNSLESHVMGILAGKEYVRIHKDEWVKGKKAIDLKSLVSTMTKKLIQRAVGDEYWQKMVASQGGWALEYVAESLAGTIANQQTIKEIAYQVDGALIEKGVLRESKEIQRTYEINPDYIAGVLSLIETKGGAGSGNFGHAGRPGKVGGSAPGKGGKTSPKYQYDNLVKVAPASVAKIIKAYGGGAEGLKKTINAYFKGLKSPSLDDYRKELNLFIKNGAPRSDIFRENIDGHNYTFEDSFYLTRAAEVMGINPFGKKKEIDLSEFIDKKKVNLSDFVASLPEPSAAKQTSNPTPSKESGAYRINIKGGQGSGNFGHAGRPGEIGGSVPAGHGGNYIGESGESYSHMNTQSILRYLESETKRLTIQEGQMSKPREGVTRDQMSRLFKMRSLFGTATSTKYRGGQLVSEYIDECIADGFNQIKKDRTFWRLYKDNDPNYSVNVRDKAGMAYVELLDMLQKSEKEMATKGGQGSGNFGHAGRPGKVGGSAPTKSGGGKSGETSPSKKYSERDLLRRAIEDKGFSLRVPTGKFAKMGMVVSPYPDEGEVYSPEDLSLEKIRAYIKKNNKLLQGSNHYFGAWFNLEDKPPKVYLDVSIIVKTRAQACKICVDKNQLAFYDIEKGVTVYVDKNGNIISEKECEVLISMSEEKEKDGGVLFYGIDADASDEDLQALVDDIQATAKKLQAKGQKKADKDRDDLMNDLGEGKK